MFFRLAQRCFILALFSFTCLSVFGSQTLITINTATSQINQLQSSLAELLRVRNNAVRDFIREHADENTIAAHLDEIETIIQQPESSAAQLRTRNMLRNMLQDHIDNRTALNRITNNFQLPPFPSDGLSRLNNALKRVINMLREPDKYGNFRYANHLKQFGGYAHTQRLTAHQEIGTWQEYNNTFNEKIYEINIYAPTRNGLFRNNRDVFIDQITVRYSVKGEEKMIRHQFDRFLRRGERIDFPIGEIADKISLNITYACRREHRGSAQFVVQPVLAKIQDSFDSPYANHIEQLQSFSIQNKTIIEAQQELGRISEVLSGAALVNSMLRSNN